MWSARLNHINSSSNDYNGIIDGSCSALPAVRPKVESAAEDTHIIMLGRMNENMYCISGSATQTQIDRVMYLLSVSPSPNGAIHICCCRKQWVLV